MGNELEEEERRARRTKLQRPGGRTTDDGRLDRCVSTYTAASCEGAAPPLLSSAKGPTTVRNFMLPSTALCCAVLRDPRFAAVPSSRVLRRPPAICQWGPICEDARKTGIGRLQIGAPRGRANVTSAAGRALAGETRRGSWQATMAGGVGHGAFWRGRRARDKASQY